MIWLILVSVVWGLSFGLIGNTLSGLPSSYVAGMRLAMCLLVFLPLAKGTSCKRALGLMLVGGIQFGLMYVAYIKAFTLLKSYEVAIFTIFTPIYVTLLDDLIGRKWSSRSLAAALLAVVGAGVILWQGWTGFDASTGKGFLIVQLSNLCFAVGQLFYARWVGVSGMKTERSVFVWMYLGAVLAVLPFTTWQQWKTGLSQTSAEQWYALVYLGVVASGVCFFLWNYGARRVSSGRLAVMNNLKIPLAAAFSICLFGEQPSWITLAVGFGLLLVSIMLTGRKSA